MAGLAAASALVPLPLVGAAPAAATTLELALAGLLWLALPVLVAYALVQHKLFRIDFRIRWTSKQSTVAAAFVGVFFVVSETGALAFSQAVGPYLGIAAAGLLLFAMAPLQRMAERVASAVLPGTRRPGAMAATERAALDREHAQLAWLDGQLTRKQKLMLEHLRKRLGLRAAEAARLEREAAEA